MQRSLVLFTTAAILFAGARAAAMPDGISGYSGLSADKTCATCHPGGNPPIATIDGPKMLAPGDTGHYTFTLKTEKTYGGLDVAVDDAGARLMPVSPMTQLLGGELTHMQPLPVQNGAIVVEFALLAPSTPGTVTLHADGQADKMPQIADSSATAIDFAVTIGAGSATGGNGASGGGAGSGAGAPGTTAAVPMHGCAFVAGAPALDAPAWLALVAGLALLFRWRRD